MDIKYDTVLTKDTKVFKSETGSPTLQEYEYKFDKSGHKMLVKKDSSVNVYERIQADRDSCDIQKLMERFVLGDKEALNKAPAYYIDTRDMPKTYAEVFQRGLEAEQLFDSLPKELKEKFDNSYSVFYNDMGSDRWNKIINEYNERFVDHKFDTKEPEIKPDEGGATF